MDILSMLVIIFLLICIFGLLSSYEFEFNDNNIKTKLLAMMDAPIYLRRAHRKHLKDVYDYCSTLEHHSALLAEHFDNRMLKDQELKIKIRNVKEIIYGDQPKS